MGYGTGALWDLLKWSIANVMFFFMTWRHFNTLRSRQNGRHFPIDIFKWIILNENVWISINISLKFVPRGPINNIPTLVQVMAWRRPGDKPLSEPMMVRLRTHICVTRPQWVNEPFPMLNWVSSFFRKKASIGVVILSEVQKSYCVVLYTS